eukprot:TRINITY_DN119_c0_g1_i1.p1 TRINITY_DN119_c0_g1~~TRINITY_DN119_c0_g1_i1.p1  ORF type:complete len:96 (-),score=0.35 TRINITY_DN119_c0_g1_i1:269-556(-)
MFYLNAFQKIGPIYVALCTHNNILQLDYLLQHPKMVKNLVHRHWLCSRHYLHLHNGHHVHNILVLYKDLMVSYSIEKYAATKESYKKLIVFTGLK